MFMFASMLDHAERDLQLSDSDLDRLFAGDDEFKNYKMGYPRFILFGSSNTRYFDPDEALDGEVPSWYDPLFTSISSENYSKMSDNEKKRSG